MRATSAPLLMHAALTVVMENLGPGSDVQPTADQAQIPLRRLSRNFQGHPPHRITVLMAQDLQEPGRDPGPLDWDFG